MSMISLYHPGFLMFLGGIERGKLHEEGQENSVGALRQIFGNFLRKWWY